MFMYSACRSSRVFLSRPFRPRRVLAVLRSGVFGDSRDESKPRRESKRSIVAIARKRSPPSTRQHEVDLPPTTAQALRARAVALPGSLTARQICHARKLLADPEVTIKEVAAKHTDRRRSSRCCKELQSRRSSPCS